MNKAERHRRKMVRYRRRLRVLGLREADGHHAYRSSGKPCSCGVCSPNRHDDKPAHSTMKRQ